MFADGWFSVFSLPSVCARGSGMINERLAGNGRDLGSVVRAVLVMAVLLAARLTYLWKGKLC
jgi:hypothetical protein